jgi:hypothetical protein
VQDRGHNGKLFIVAVLARLLPRDWDGRRLLRFLTGLALLALSFTVPAAPALAAPALAAPALAAPALAAPALAAPAVAVVAPAPVAVSQPAPAAESTAAATAATEPVAAARSAMQSREYVYDASRISRVERRAADTAGPAGVTAGAHDSRGPPRH